MYFTFVTLLIASMLAAEINGQICDSTNLIDGTSYMAPGVARYSAYLQIFTDLRMSCSGTLVQWGIVQNANVVGQSVYLDIWRPSADGITFTLIGSTRVTVTSAANSVQVFSVAAGQQFQVQINDIVGMHYDSINTTASKSIVPYLDPENAPGTTATIVWKLQHSDILNQGNQVSVAQGNTIVLATDQQRLPALLAYLSTTGPATTPVATQPPPSTVPVITSGASTLPPIIHISIGNFGFNWPGLMTPPSLIINSASSVFVLASATLIGRSFILAAISMFLASIPNVLAQTSPVTVITAQNFSDLKVNGTEVWKILAGVGGAAFGIIIILVILVVCAFVRRPGGKGARNGYKTFSNGKEMPGIFVQTEFHSAFAKRGNKVDSSTMTKRSIFTPPPPLAKRSEDYYALKAHEHNRHQEQHNNNVVFSGPINNNNNSNPAAVPTTGGDANNNGAPHIIRMHFGDGADGLTQRRY